MRMLPGEQENATPSLFVGPRIKGREKEKKVGHRFLWCLGILSIPRQQLAYFRGRYLSTRRLTDAVAVGVAAAVVPLVEALPSE